MIGGGWLGWTGHRGNSLLGDGRFAGDRCGRSRLAGGGRCLGRRRRAGDRGGLRQPHCTPDRHRDRDAPQTFHDNTPALSELYSNRRSCRSGTVPANPAHKGARRQRPAPHRLPKDTPGPGEIIGSVADTPGTCPFDTVARNTGWPARGRTDRARLGETSRCPDEATHFARLVRPRLNRRAPKDRASLSRS